MGQTRPLFVYYRSFRIILRSNLTINDKCIDGVLGSRTQGGRMEDAELWRHPNIKNVLV